MLLQGLGFFTSYANSRKAHCTTESDSEGEKGNNYEEFVQVSREQEVLYNMGSIYRDLILYHFAIEFYDEALSLNDNYCERMKKLGRQEDGRLPLTPECAHNLVLVHKECGNNSKAMEVMKKYLTY